MGQQQILLTVLVVIIVGIATVVAVDTMYEARKNASESAIRQDILMVMNDARVYYHKPSAMGGGGNSFQNISEDQILSIDSPNENAAYSISGTNNTVEVQAISAFDGDTLSATGTMNGDTMTLSWASGP